MSGTEEFPRDALVKGRQLGRWWEGKKAVGEGRTIVIYFYFKTQNF